MEEQLEMGLTLVLDYNEERQINVNAKPKIVSNEMKAFYDDVGESASIYLDTISLCFKRF